jgi:hypothetical protein
MGSMGLDANCCIMRTLLEPYSPLQPMEATSTEIAYQYVRPSLQHLTVVLSYITLAIVGLVAILLVISFFGALKVGAEVERKVNYSP